MFLFIPQFISYIKEKDFEGAPETHESDGIYQFIEIEGTTYFRNVDTGEIG